MGSKALTDEEKAKYEKELTDFIIQRIKNGGGSIQFQHLNNLSPQLSFETKNAFASNKFQLMKFLRSRPKVFKIDSKGIVNIVENSSLDIDSPSENENIVTEQECILPQHIENGAGKISKIHAEFGFIAATEPFKTKVYFRASSFSRECCLLTELNLEIGKEVSFNAVKGHMDSEAQYRALKVWFTGGPPEIGCKNEPVERKNISGKGSIQKIFPEYGFILISGQTKDTVFFSKHNLHNQKNITQLADIFNVGDQVIFNAIRSSKKESKAKWEATSVRRLDQCDDSESYEYNKNTEYDVQKNSPVHKRFQNDRKDIIRNIKGKISPLKFGANILFGEHFSNIASAGESCVFFLYGSQVFEISWEFSDGDDVIFDAVKIKAEPGWKAVMVWVGERPNFVLPVDLGDFSEFTDESDETVQKTAVTVSSNQLHQNCDEVHPDESYYFPADDSINSSLKTCKPRSKNSKYKSALKENYEKQSYKSGVNDYSNFTSKASKKNVKANKLEKNKDCLDNSECARRKTSSNDDEYFSSTSDHNSKEHVYRKSISEKSSKNQSRQYHLSSFKSNEQCDDELRNTKQGRNFLVVCQDEQECDYSNKEYSDPNEKIQSVSSIKLHKGISCEITIVHCKLAYAKNTCLQNQVVFVSNAFYSDGCSADELQIDDLREVLHPGDFVKLNCFEIVDDFGKNHHKVTMAWLGKEPQLSEMTPEDFIYENDLSVTIGNQSSVHEPCTSNLDSKHISQAVSSSGSDDDQEAITSISESSSSEDSSDMELSFLSKDSKSLDVQERECDFSDNELSDKPIDFKAFSDLIANKLEDHGLLYNPKMDLDSLSTKIVELIQQVNQEAKSPVCPKCSNILSEEPIHSSSVTKEVQTIVTGNIVAQSIYTEI